MKYFAAFVLAFPVYCFSQVPSYKDSSLPIETRVNDLLGRMTTEEKFWQLFMCPGDTSITKDTASLHGIFGLQVSAEMTSDPGAQMLHYNSAENFAAVVNKINRIQEYFVEKTRLGIPAIMFDEALHGLVRAGCTSFPQSIALAATFDTALVYRVACSIADETRARGVRQVLSPVINIATDVRWGRVEETYGEDPVLTSAAGVAFVRAFEERNIITTPKHMIANVGDGGRDSYPIYFDERLLDEVHFPPFKDCIRYGGTRSVMTAYNSLNGIPCSSNAWLLQAKLKGEWGFRGFVISDANAVGGDIVLHHTAKNYADAGANAINNGLDVIFQSDFNHYRFFRPAFLDGRVDTARLNDAVSRVLRAKFELGLFEHPYADTGAARKIVNDSLHRSVAMTAALESIVLLKNEAGTLPLAKNVRTVAVIGEDADTARLGGYSGPGIAPVTILSGLKKAAPGVHFFHEKGVGVFDRDFHVVPSTFLKTPGGKEGLSATYYNNITLDGPPAAQKTDPVINFQWTLSLPDRAIKTDFYSARWEGTLTSPKTGTFKVGLEGNDGFRLYIDDKLVIDNWKKRSYSRLLYDYSFQKDHPYRIRIEFFEPVGNAHLKLIWNVEGVTNWHERIQKAVAAAMSADVAIICAGIHEGEFQDRGILSLPNHQEELINAVARTGKPVIVVLIGGSAITMGNWLPNVKAVVDAWYPGEQGGNAVAQVLFGLYDPAGRLPVTFPVSEGQPPLVYNHASTGRGDDYYNLSGLPEFPFGFGLSYTDFSYSDLRLDRGEIAAGETAIAHFTVTNTGKVAGDEVVQLYIHKVLSRVSLPVIQLKNFERVHLGAGETKQITLAVTPAMLSIFDRDLKQVVEPGEFSLMIGASSRDIRLKTVLKVK